MGSIYGVSGGAGRSRFFVEVEYSSVDCVNMSSHISASILSLASSSRVETMDSAMLGVSYFFLEIL